MEERPSEQPQRTGTLQYANTMKIFPKYRRRIITRQVKAGMAYLDTKMHADLANLRKDGTTNWHRVDDYRPVDPDYAMEEKLNDRILFYLDDYLIHNIKRPVLHRQVCEDFQRWTKPVWSRANKKLRTKLRNMMETHDVFFNAHMHLVPEMLAEFVEQVQRPAKASYAGPAPRSSPAHTSWESICTYVATCLGQNPESLSE
ncbi:hypothetical protein E4U31_007079 [Claviceps sp. LM219 group G6]|nr:hypothetical protein E4U31_007079 [Claviceps sp. LM219 group G6]